MALFFIHSSIATHRAACELRIDRFLSKGVIGGEIAASSASVWLNRSRASSAGGQSWIATAAVQ